MGPSRRTMLKLAGTGLAASVLRNEAAAASEASPAKIWSGDYTAKKGDVSLYMFRKRRGAPRKANGDAPVLFLVHGSSISSRPTFDLTVPGKGRYSLMDTFAEYGFDVWTMDHESYGRSARTGGNSDIATGVLDLAAGLDVVPRETGRSRAHFMGETPGALRAAAFATAHPDRVDRL